MNPQQVGQRLNDTQLIHQEFIDCVRNPHPVRKADPGLLESDGDARCLLILEPMDP